MRVRCNSRWQRSLSLLAEMQDQGLSPNVITYSSAISACGQSYQWQMAVQLFDDMQWKYLWPNVITFNALISACGHGLQWLCCLYNFFAKVGVYFGLDVWLCWWEKGVEVGRRVGVDFNNSDFEFVVLCTRI